MQFKFKGQKRAADTDGPPAKKGKPEPSAEFEAIAAELAPHLGDVIDSYGGVCSLAVISLDETWKQFVSKIGPGTKVKKIVDLYTEYLVPLADGHHVATAKGYDEGLVLEDGSVDKEKMRAKWAEKKQADKENGIAPSGPKPKSAPNAQPGQLKTGPTLQQALSKLHKAAHMDDAEFEAAIREVRTARKESNKNKTVVPPTSNTRLGPKPAKDGLPKQQLMPYATYVRQMMVGKGYVPGQPMRLGELASDNEAKAIREQCGGASTKMIKLLELFSEFFGIEYDEGNKAMCSLVLTEQGAKINPQMKVDQSNKPFKGKGNAGKGKKFLR